MDFIDNLEQNSILVIPDNIKDKVLDRITLSNKLINIKIMSFNEIKKSLLFDYSNEAIYYVMRNYQVNYMIAKDYINNIYYLDKDNYDNSKLNTLVEIKNKLIDNKLLIYDKLFKKLICSKSKLYVYGFDKLDKFQEFLLDKLKKNINIDVINKDDNNYVHDVYKYKTIDEEVFSVAERIMTLLDKKIPLNKIYIANYSEEYYFSMHKIFKLFNIPYDKNAKTSLYDTVIGRFFLDNLDSNIERLLFKISKKFDIKNNIYDNNLYSKLVGLINNYYWCNNILEIKDLVMEEFKLTKIPYNHYKNEVKLTNILDNEFDDDEYVFLVGFNLGSVPKIKKDEDFIDDKNKTSIMMTSMEENRLEKDKYIRAMHNIKNLFVSFKETTPFDTYFPSVFIDGINFILKEDNTLKYSNYSKEYNKLLYAAKIDNLIKFNEKDESLKVLNNNYDIDYGSYSNKFDGVKKDKLIPLIEKKAFSYSNISTYYKCPFRFYLSYFFDLDKYEQTIDAFIGSLFHYVLEECIIDKSKDIDLIYDKYISDHTWNEGDSHFGKRTFNNHDKYFVEKLRKEVHFIVENIRKQYEYSSHDINKEWHEEKLVFDTRDLDLNVKVNAILTGIVDKCLFVNNNVVIVDYKTGTSDTIKREYFEFGVSIQLPIYLYLLRNIKDTKYNIVGMYLQHILIGFIKQSDVEKLDGDDINNIRIKNLKLDGITLDKEDKIKEFDKSYEHSEVIQSLLKTTKGTWRYPKKLMDDDEFNKLYDLVKKLIEDCINNVSDGIFDIAPIKLEKKINGCDFCKYKDICYRKPYDIHYLVLKEGDEDE